MSTIKVSIPAVVSREGKVHAWVNMDAEGEHHEDVGLIYDFFKEDDETKEIRVEAELDLDAIFSSVTIKGEVAGPEPEKESIPTTLEETFEALDREGIESDSLEAWIDLPEKEAIAQAHHGVGRWIRNAWIYPNYFADTLDGTLVGFFAERGLQHHDDMSGVILHSYHRHKNGLSINLDEQILHYRKYWRKQGVDPDGLITQNKNG